MTRFMISLDQGVDLVWHALEDMIGGEVYVKKIPSMKVIELAKSLLPGSKNEIVGIRPGEKLHEQMIGTDDAPYTYEYPNHYKILPAIFDWNLDNQRIKDGIKVEEDFSYTSDNNKHWMTNEELITWVENNKSVIGKI